MERARKAFAFRWVLPIAQLLLCLVILWPIRSGLISEVRRSVRTEKSTNAARQEPEVVLNRYDFQMIEQALQAKEVQQELRAEKIRERRLWAPALLNIPVMFVQLVYVIPSSSKMEWVPKGMDFKAWRALSWPLVGIVFWWLAGRGVDALLAVRRQLVRPAISWIETVVAGLVVLSGLVIGLSILCNSSGYDDLPSIWFGAAGAMWALLGSATIAAKFAQWRIRRRLSAVKSAEASSA